VDNEKFCKEVLKLDPGIRFAIISNRFGKRIAGGYKDNTISLLSPDEIQFSLFLASRRWDTRKKLSHRIGEPRYSVTEYEKLKQITLAVSKRNLLLVSIELKTDHNKLIKKIWKLLEN